jgi:hypothetical protein
MSYADVVEHWRADEPFRAFFAALLADPPFKAYFWETPPVTQATAARAFEFVLVDSPELAALAPEPDAFAGHFIPSQAVATFPNIGGDALSLPRCGKDHPRPMPTSRPSRDRRRCRSSMRCGRPLALQWQGAFPPRRSGSACPGWELLGCTCGWMSGRSTIPTSLTVCRPADIVANLDLIRALPILRVPGTGLEPELNERQLHARRRVHEALQAPGGISSPPGSCVWHVVGLQRSVREWAIR